MQPTDEPAPTPRPGRDPRRRRTLAPLDVPRQVVDFMQEAAQGRSTLGKLGHIATHPGAARQAVGILRRIPTLTITGLEDDPQSNDLILAPLQRNVSIIPTGRLGQSVLEIPLARPYVAGRSRTTMRAKAKQAQDAGQAVRRLPTDHVRELATAVMRADGRTDAEIAARLGVDGLPGVHVWMAFDADGAPICYDTLAISGRYARIVGSVTRGPGDPEARWLLQAAIVTDLAAEGCRWLMVDSALKQTPELSHLQTLCGFIAMNVVAPPSVT